MAVMNQRRSVGGGIADRRMDVADRYNELSGKGQQGQTAGKSGAERRHRDYSLLPARGMQANIVSRVDDRGGPVS